MSDEVFWWLNKPFQVFTKHIPTQVQKHMGDHVLTCKVTGADYVLKTYQIEIVGGDQDGIRFEVGFGWIDSYIQPDQSE